MSMMQNDQEAQEAPKGWLGKPLPVLILLFPVTLVVGLYHLMPYLFFKQKVEDVDMEFMTDADAALYRRGQPRAYVVSLAVFLFVFIFIIWASFTEIDEITRGEGQVISAQRVQEIQYLEGGMLEEVLVQEGSDVLENQVVARISNVLAASALQEQKDNKATLEAMIARLEAETNDTDPVFSAELIADYPSVVAGQQDLHKAHLRQQEAEMLSLEAQLEQRKKEIEEGSSKQRSLRENLALARKQRDTVRPLVDKGIYPRVDYMRLEQSVASLNGDYESAVTAVSRARSAVEEVEQRINSRKLEWRSAAQEELNKKRAELTTVNTMLEAKDDTVTRRDLRSPVKGKVKRILINTRGGTVAPGATIMEILPIDDHLLIEVRIQPTDRAFLYTSDDPAHKQKAVIKIGAYDFSIYGGLNATLEHISSDTIEDQKRGDLYYQARLLTSSNSIVYRGKDLPIMPGMTATADIITGKKTVLSYLLKPIIKAKQNAFRER